MSITAKSEFGVMCRNLRVSRNLKQREVAEAIGISVSTYANMESSPWRVVSEEKVIRLANFYGLAQAVFDELLERWSKTELSEYGKQSRERWEKRNAQRSKAKRAAALERALIDVLAVTFEVSDSAGVPPCRCTFGGEVCEVCAALAILGAPPFTTTEAAVENLAALQRRIENEAAAAAERGKAP